MEAGPAGNEVDIGLAMFDEVPSKVGAPLNDGAPETWGTCPPANEPPGIGGIRGMGTGSRPQLPQKRAFSGNSNPQYWQRCISFLLMGKWRTFALIASSIS